MKNKETMKPISLNLISLNFNSYRNNKSSMEKYLGF